MRRARIWRGPAPDQVRIARGDAVDYHEHLELQFSDRLRDKNRSEVLELLRAAAGLSEWRAPEGTASWRATAAADQERGLPMGPTHQEEATLASYRDAVTERISAGEAFGDIEDAIDDLGGLTSDQKAALWLFALTLHERGKQQRDAGARLLAVY